MLGFEFLLGASRMAGVIEQPVFGRGFLQLFHFTAGLERKRAFPSRWRARGSIAGVSRGVWVQAIWRARPSSCQRLTPVWVVWSPQVATIYDSRLSTAVSLLRGFVQLPLTRTSRIPGCAGPLPLRPCRFSRAGRFANLRPPRPGKGCASTPRAIARLPDPRDRWNRTSVRG